MLSIGRIYEIINKEGKRYIGSTRKTLKERFSRHFNQRNDFNKGTRYSSSSFQILDNSEIRLLEEGQYTNKELLFRERHFIETTINVNKNVPIRSKEEKSQVKKIYNHTYRQRLKQRILDAEIQAI